MGDIPGAPDDVGSLPAKPSKKGLSLKARAIAFLSRREHSRLELSRKLAKYADNSNDLDQLLDQLESENWLSNERFAQSLVHRRAPLQGTTRIVQELKQHGLDDARVAAWREQLRSTELERARTVWQKKFGRPAETANDYARQFRFLASRGFSSDCLRRILGEFDDERR